MVPLVAPWLTRLMKVVSCIVVTLYVYGLWRVDRLMATDALALLVTAAGATLVRAAKRDRGAFRTGRIDGAQSSLFHYWPSCSRVSGKLGLQVFEKVLAAGSQPNRRERSLSCAASQRRTAQWGRR